VIPRFPLFWQVVQAAAFLTPPGSHLPKPAATMARRKATQEKQISSEEENSDCSDVNDEDLSHEEADNSYGEEEAKSDQEEMEVHKIAAKRTFGKAECDLCGKSFEKTSTSQKSCMAVVEPKFALRLVHQEEECAKAAAAMRKIKAPKHEDISSEEEDEEGSEGNDRDSHEKADDSGGEAKSDQEEAEDQSRPAKRTFGLAQCDLCYKTFVKQSTNHKYCTSVECRKEIRLRRLVQKREASAEAKSRPAKRTFGQAGCYLCHKTFVKHRMNQKYCTRDECRKEIHLRRLVQKREKFAKA
jgi:hypothetical protein